MILIRNTILLGAVPLLLGLTGCGGGPNVVKVTGTLTYKGKPVTNARIDFIPLDGQRPSWGATDAQGRFSLEYDDKIKGAAVGKHKVSVVMRPTTVAEQEAVMEGRAPPVPREMAEFFKKYSAENSTVEVTIDKSTDLKLDWD